MGRLHVAAPLIRKGFDMKSTQSMEDYRAAMFLDYQVWRVQAATVQALADLSGVEGSGAARLRGAWGGR